MLCLTIMSMNIVIDSREKKNQHILDYFTTYRIPYVVRKMDIADYMIEGNSSVVVDRKQNLDELIHNLFGKDKRRFYNEMRLAYEKHVKIAIVCEHGSGVTSVASVSRFQSKHSKITGQQLQAEIERVRLAYGVDFVFCEKWETANEILKILGVDKND